MGYVLNIIAIVISIVSIAVSYFVSREQLKISRRDSDMQNKVELYLCVDGVSFHDANAEKEDLLIPAIIIKNVGNNVVYLERYVFNGKEYLLGQYVLPPAATTDAIRYIELPRNGEAHVSFEIFFEDWQGYKWHTKGFSDLADHIWNITYKPCERFMG